MLPRRRFAPLPACAQGRGGGLTPRRGFLVAGVASGVKKRGKLDLALLASEQPASRRRRSPATPPPPRRCGSRATPATAATCGPWWSTPATPTPSPASRASPTPRACGCSPPTTCGCRSSRWPCASTGLIGVPLPMDKIEPGHRRRRAALPGGRRRRRTSPRPSAPPTSTPRPAPWRCGCRRAGQAGVRGQGLRHDQPQHGDDAVLRHLRRRGRRSGLDRLLHEARRRARFNRITVDGQESTNDMVARLLQRRLGREARGGGAGAARRGARGRAASLAVSIVADGEGSTRTDEAHGHRGARRGEAEAVARAVANSPLVKTAFYGRDANWGRIMQAIGQALGPRGPHAPAGRIAYEDVLIVEQGQPAALDAVQQGRLDGHHAPARDRPEGRAQRARRRPHRVLQRPDPRLRHPQRGVLDMTVRGTRRPSGPSRGHAVHPPVLGRDRRPQVRRRGDDLAAARRSSSPRTSCCCAWSA